MTHICVRKLSTLGSDNGLSPGRRQAIIGTNAGILLIWPLGTNLSMLSEILIEIRIFSFKKMVLNVLSAKWWPFCLGLNVNVIIFCETGHIHCIFGQQNMYWWTICTCTFPNGYGLITTQKWLKTQHFFFFGSCRRQPYTTKSLLINGTAVKWGNSGHFFSWHVCSISHATWWWKWMVTYHGSCFVVQYFPN